MKREVIVGPAVDKTVAHESVGLKPVTVPKEHVIKKKAPVLQVFISSVVFSKATCTKPKHSKLCFLDK